MSDDLLVVKYARVDVQSPQFATTYEGINQSVDVKITTVVCQAAPEPVVALYDFIMTTFVPEDRTPASTPAIESSPDASQAELDPQAAAEQKIKVVVKLAGVQS